ncbi:cell wall hydrolase [Lacrimispora sp.]|uniref:cell wall hydrolase n=1 Tax=Lacrimispora sp. TaxID=2719234 RepID=UPI0028AE1EFE|nr:cell wall hydrolase [Lacrimispora sp.]
MRKLLIVGTLSLCLTLTMPMATWANNIEETVTTAQFEEALPYVTDMTPKYTQANVNIRKEPNVNSEVYGQTLLNMSVDVIVEIGGWSMIYAEDCENNYAFIKSEYLLDTEIKYSEEDLYVMAHLIAGEAQPCDDAEQRYVASVVLNRVKHPGFANTIKDVVFEKGQYACIPKRTYYREPTESNWANAKWILENGSIIPDYVIWQSKDKQGKGVYLKTKWHTYCY